MGILGGLSKIIYIKAFCPADDDDVSDDEQKAGGGNHFKTQVSSQIGQKIHPHESLQKTLHLC